MKTPLAIAALLLSSVGVAGPVPFEPMIHPDGTRTWKITVPLKHLRYVPQEYRDSPKRDEWIAGSSITHARFCDAWEITSSRQDKKNLYLEGRCK